MALSVLPGYGYSTPQIDQVIAAIQATQIPQVPQTLLGALLADADLAVLGQRNFWARNAQLRTELAGRGCFFTDTEWYRDQLRFLQSHSYWTAAARRLWNPGLQVNISILSQQLAEC